MKNILYIAGLVFLISSCVEKYPEGLGQAIVAAPEGFSVTSGGVSFSTGADNVDFDTDSVFLEATFSSTVTVNAVYRGLTSGAVRTMTITAENLDHTNSAWYGEFDSGTSTFFHSGEAVEISMSFYNSELIYKDTMTINSALTYKNSANLVLVDPRTNGLESNGFESVQNWYWWFDGGTLNSHKGEAISQRRNDIPAAEGDYYLEITGIAPAGGVYIGGASYGHGSAFNPQPSSPTAFYDLPADASNVWFNMYVYGEEEEITDLYVEIREADSGVKSNGDPEDPFFVNGRDDGVQILQKFDHKGWQLVSYQYSSLPFAGYCLAGLDGGGCGTKSHDSDRIKLVAFSLQSEQKALPVSAKIDYCMFTVGGPFDPVTFKR